MNAGTRLDTIRTTSRSDTLNIDAVQAPTPFSEGYRRLLSAVLSHPQGHVVSAPMAWFIMRKGCRFLFSNDFGYVCVDGMLGPMTASRTVPCGPSVFLDNKLNDYVFRPKELKHVNLYNFIGGRLVCEFATSRFLTYSNHTQHNTHNTHNTTISTTISHTPTIKRAWMRKFNTK